MHMRTTIDIPDPLFREAKRRAAAEGLTLREVVLRALRAHLGGSRPRGYRFRWRTEKGTQLIPDEALRSRAALYDSLGGRE
jgi:hypothetical protein